VNAEAVLMVIKTTYGVGAYLLTAMCAIIWFGIALSSERTAFWASMAASAFGFAMLFTALAVLATGNPLLGQEVNAWFLRTFGWMGGIFLMLATWIFLFNKWHARTLGDGER
jgi:hypothetical protein